MCSFCVSDNGNDHEFWKMADSIEVPFGVVGQIGPRIYLLDGVQLLHGKRQNFEEHGAVVAAQCKASRMRLRQCGLFLFLVFNYFNRSAKQCTLN